MARKTYGFHHGWQLRRAQVLAKKSFVSRAGRPCTENLLQLHDTRVGANVVDGRLLPDLTRVIFLLEDIGKGQRLLRCRRHLGLIWFFWGFRK